MGELDDYQINDFAGKQAASKLGKSDRISGHRNMATRGERVQAQFLACYDTIVVGVDSFKIFYYTNQFGRFGLRFGNAFWCWRVVASVRFFGCGAVQVHSCGWLRKCNVTEQNGGYCD
jgi:hypothetical protein